jgi:hypothetical protein
MDYTKHRTCHVPVSFFASPYPSSFDIIILKAQVFSKKWLSFKEFRWTENPTGFPLQETVSVLQALGMVQSDTPHCLAHQIFPVFPEWSVVDWLNRNYVSTDAFLGSSSDGVLVQK